MRRLDELLAAYPSGQRSELERELLAEVQRLRADHAAVRDAALEQAATICDELAADVYAHNKREDGLVAAQLAAAIRSRKGGGEAARVAGRGSIQR
jgi:outer membrane PBP1 activator LpoA protein